MVTDSFFNKQTDLTAAKIKIFQDYIEGYLIKLLMTFEKNAMLKKLNGEHSTTVMVGG